MPSERALFTVVVPAVGRPETLRYTLATLTRQRYERFQVIVCASSRQGWAEQAVNATHDCRVQFLQVTGPGLSQACDLALLNLTDEGWVTVVPAGDGLLPGALELVHRVSLATGCQALASAPCLYAPPGQTPSGTLTIPPGSGYSTHGSQVGLNRLMRGQCSLHDLPSIFGGGFAQMQAIRRACANAGRSARWSQIHITLALASVTDSYVCLHRPIAIVAGLAHITMEPGGSLTWLGQYPDSDQLAIYESYLETESLRRSNSGVWPEQQLGLSLGRARPEEYAPLVRYVEDLVSLQRLDRHEVFAWESRARRQVRPASNQTFSGYGARNILEAAQIAAAVTDLNGDIGRPVLLTALRARLKRMRGKLFYDPRLQQLARRALPGWVRRRLVARWAPTPALLTPAAWSAHDQAMLEFYAALVPRGGLCFDVGANLGNRVKIFRELQARVVAIEPQPECVRNLEETFGTDKRVTILTTALGAAEGTAEMRIGTDQGISSLSGEWMEAVRQSGRFSGFSWDRTQTVQVTTLDRLIAQFGVPDFVKVDVEGFEEQVVKGLSRPLKMLSLEFTPEFIESTLRCLKHLGGLGEIRLNYSLLESMQMALDRWEKPAEMEELLRALGPDNTLYGDLYVHFC